MLIKMQCPQCGALMEVDDDKEQVFCTYCGTRIANLKEKIEITQNVNMSGAVRHIIDRSNDPNLYISYASAVPSVVMVVRIVDTGTKNTYLNGQSQTYHLSQGTHTIVLKIGKKNYNRTIVIPEDNTPVRINASYTGRRAEITIDQPPIIVTDAVTGQQKQQAVVTEGKKQSALAIISFILSFLAYAAFVAVPLAIIDLIRSKKDKAHKHGLAIAALIIGSIMSLFMIVGLIGGTDDEKISETPSQSGWTAIGEAAEATATEKAELVMTEKPTATAEPIKAPTQKPTETPTPKPTETPSPTPTEDPTPKEYKNALASAQKYVDYMHMSKAQLYQQLTSEYGEGFSADAAKYAVDHVNANWKENALKTAETYSEIMHMSKAGIYDQLVSKYGEQFTAEEAQYAIDHIVADWNANALAKAKSYRDTMNMSKAAIKKQLTSSYGEKFTEKEAQYAIDHLDD